MWTLQALHLYDSGRPPANEGLAIGDDTEEVSAAGFSVADDSAATVVPAVGVSFSVELGKGVSAGAMMSTGADECSGENSGTVLPLSVFSDTTVLA